MAHEITTRANGAVEMAYVAGTKRWHGLGNELVPGASIEEWRKAAGMEWKVQRSKVRYPVGPELDVMKVWDDQHVLFRSDTKEPLGVVGAGFKVVQPGETLEFFRDLCDTNGFTLRTAGTLFGGRRFWALADIGAESFVLDHNDKVKGRLLLVTACDGSLKTTAKFIAECVVCNNTLSMGLAESGKSVAVSHRSIFNPSDVKARLGLADGQFNAFIGDIRALARKPVSTAYAEELTLRLLVGENPTIAAAEAVREAKGYKAILALFGGTAIASTLPGRSGTAWGWLNAVTEYADHHVATRSADNRFNSSQFGPMDDRKTKALELALLAA